MHPANPSCRTASRRNADFLASIPPEPAGARCGDLERNGWRSAARSDVNQAARSTRAVPSRAATSGSTRSRSMASSLIGSSAQAVRFTVLFHLVKRPTYAPTLADAVPTTARPRARRRSAIRLLTARPNPRARPIHIASCHVLLRSVLGGDRCLRADCDLLRRRAPCRAVVRTVTGATRVSRARARSRPPPASRPARATPGRSSPVESRVNRSTISRDSPGMPAYSNVRAESRALPALRPRATCVSCRSR